MKRPCVLQLQRAFYSTPLYTPHCDTFHCGHARPSDRLWIRTPLDLPSSCENDRHWLWNFVIDTGRLKFLDFLRSPLYWRPQQSLLVVRPGADVDIGPWLLGSVDSAMRAVFRSTMSCTGAADLHWVDTLAALALRDSEHLPWISCRETGSSHWDIVPGIRHT